MGNKMMVFLLFYLPQHPWRSFNSPSSSLLGPSPNGSHQNPLFAQFSLDDFLLRWSYVVSVLPRTIEILEQIAPTWEELAKKKKKLKQLLLWVVKWCSLSMIDKGNCALHCLVSSAAIWFMRVKFPDSDTHRRYCQPLWNLRDQRGQIS